MFFNNKTRKTLKNWKKAKDDTTKQTKIIEETAELDLNGKIEKFVFLPQFINLQYVNLGRNNLTEIYELASLVLLETLDLNHNELLFLPSIVFNPMKRLKHLNMGSNYLTNRSFDDLDRMETLETFSVDNNHLTEIPPAAVFGNVFLLNIQKNIISFFNDNTTATTATTNNQNTTQILSTTRVNPITRIDNNENEYSRTNNNNVLNTINTITAGNGSNNLYNKLKILIIANTNIMKLPNYLYINGFIIVVNKGLFKITNEQIKQLSNISIYICTLSDYSKKNKYINLNDELNYRYYSLYLKSKPHNIYENFLQICRRSIYLNLIKSTELFIKYFVANANANINCFQIHNDYYKHSNIIKIIKNETKIKDENKEDYLRVVDIMEVKLLETINHPEFTEDRYVYTRYLNDVIKNIYMIDDNTKENAYIVIYYVFNQPLYFQINYVISFLYDSANAYNKNNTFSGISCSKGIQERIILSILPAIQLSCVNPKYTDDCVKRYTKIAKYFKLDLNNYIKNNNEDIKEEKEDNDDLTVATLTQKWLAKIEELKNTNPNNPVFFNKTLAKKDFYFFIILHYQKQKITISPLLENEIQKQVDEFENLPNFYTDFVVFGGGSIGKITKKHNPKHPVVSYRKTHKTHKRKTRK